LLFSWSYVISWTNRTTGLRNLFHQPLSRLREIWGLWRWLWSFVSSTKLYGITSQTTLVSSSKNSYLHLRLERPVFLCCSSVPPQLLIFCCIEQGEGIHSFYVPPINMAPA
jgi:hypothetical protein